MVSLEDLQKDIVDWANKEFPNRTLVNTFMKLHVEISELIQGGLKDPKEYADLIILALDMAYLAGIRDISGAVMDKMKINRDRIWEFDPASGTYQHLARGATRGEVPKTQSQYSPCDQEDDGYHD